MTIPSPLVTLGAVRLGLLGPLPDASTPSVVEQASDFLLTRQTVNRVIYLGADGALEAAVENWARRLVGNDPTDDAAWGRAAKLAKQGAPAEIDLFVTAERTRLRLRSLESLPHRILRTMEMVGDRVAVLIFDKGLLDEEDIFAANILIYGKSDGPLIKKIGARWFVTPGPLGPNGGVIVLDDSEAEIHAKLFDVSGNLRATEILALPKPTKLRVRGGA